MELRELRVRRLPGIDTPFTLSAAPGINLIVGPNGSGKSSLCRALRALLWPRRESYTPLDVTSVWQLRGETWQASREQTRDVRWQRDGTPAAAPALPDDRWADAYRLEIVDLLKPAADASDRELAEEIRSRMAGGYNVEKVVRDLFPDRIRIGQREQQDLTAATREVRRLTGEQSKLASEEDELRSLHRELKECRRAAVRLPVWRKAQELATAGERLAKIDAELSRFPAALADITGEESLKLEEIIGATREQRDRAAEVRQGIAGAERTLAAADLTDGPPAPALLELWQERARFCVEVQSDLRKAEQDLAVANARLASLGDTVLKEWNSATAAPVHVETVAAVEAYLNEALPLRARREGTAGLAAEVSLAPSDPPYPIEAVTRGTQLLIDWLAAGRWFSTRRIVGAVLAGFALTAAAGVVTIWRGAGGWGWPLVAAGVGGFTAAFIWGAMETTRRARWSARREECMRQFVEIGLPQPPSWNRGGVQQALAALLVLTAAHDLEARKADLRRRLAGTAADLDLALARLAQSRRDLIRRTGLDAVESESALIEFSRRVSTYHKARQERDGAAGRRDELRRELADAVSEIHRFLRSYAASSPAVPLTAAAEAEGASAAIDQPTGTPSGEIPDTGADTTAAAAAAGIRDLERRVAAYHRAVEVRASKEAHYQTIAAKLTELQQDQEELYRRTGLAVGNSAGLARLERALPDYRALCDERQRYQRDRVRLTRELARVCETARADLGAPMTPSPEGVDGARLDDLIARDEPPAARVDTLQERATRIDERVKQARAATALAEALAIRAAAAERVTERRDELQDAALGRALLTAVSHEHEQLSRPPVLDRARRLLEVFTHGDYELRVVRGSDGAAYEVTEHRTGRLLGLPQLSAGTRAQLLLAARLAHLLETEPGEPIPLLLDESLAAADPERFNAIAASLVALAGTDGRQILYLTSDPTDVARWQTVLQAAGRQAAPVVDLAVLRQLATAASTEELTVPPTPPIPQSNGYDAVSYGAAIAVPRLDPFAPAMAIHPFHVLRDRLDLVEALLRLQIVSLGQWRARAGSLRRSGALAAADADRLDARTVGAEAFLAAWRSGRGRPVDRQALAASGGVSDRFLDEVTALSRAGGGDGNALLARLRTGHVKGFRRDKIDAIEMYLTAHEYVAVGEPLDEEALTTEILRALAPQLEAGDLTVAEVTELNRGLWQAVQARGREGRQQ